MHRDFFGSARLLIMVPYRAAVPRGMGDWSEFPSNSSGLCPEEFINLHINKRSRVNRGIVLMMGLVSGECRMAVGLEGCCFAGVLFSVV